MMDLAFYAVAVPAVLLCGVSKGGLSGFGALAVPTLAMVVPPAQAVGVMLPILCLMDLFGLWAYRSWWDRSRMGVLLCGGLLGILAGTLAFDHLSDDTVRVAIGINAVLFGLNHWLRPLYRRQAAAAALPSLPKGLFWSGLSGFSSFLAHAGSPPLLVYLLPQRLQKMQLAGTTVVFFGAVNFAKLGPYVWLGQIDLVNLAQAAALAPLAPVGIWAGIWLIRRLPADRFYQFSHLLLVVTGGKLFRDGLVGLGVLG